jgi:hypothetical protein
MGCRAKSLLKGLRCAALTRRRRALETVQKNCHRSQVDTQMDPSTQVAGQSAFTRRQGQPGRQGNRAEGAGRPARDADRRTRVV